MIRAFFDECDNGAVYLMGGWMAPERVWEDFPVAWGAALCEEPSIQYFKHHEAKSASGQFLNWPANHVNPKILRLAHVISDFEMYGVVGGLTLDTHASVFADSVLSRKQLQSILRLTHPYQWCFHGVVAAVLQRELFATGRRCRFYL
jgi:hypothetical protein